MIIASILLPVARGIAYLAAGLVLGVMLGRLFPRLADWAAGPMAGTPRHRGRRP